MAKGILWVSSRVTKPDRLSPENFCAWYENTHIQEVLSLPGLPSAARYEAIQPQPSEDTWSTEAPWLVGQAPTMTIGPGWLTAYKTLYDMHHVAYRHSPDFKALDGQTAPSEELLDRIFSNTRFDTRFYAQVQDFDVSRAKAGPARFIISAALQPPAEAAPDFDDWYRQEHLAVLSRAPGFVRSRRYELVNGTVLNEFVRSQPDVPKYLALHEFEGQVLPWKELQESAETPWAKRVMGVLAKSEIGWYVLKRIYAEEEWRDVGTQSG